MDYVFEWLSLALRWAHVTVGIAWIGASFYFIWLDNHLKPPAGGTPRVAGELWSVHGGGFYHQQKFLLGPERLPDELHWFKHEAYFTWLTGVALLAVVYWHGARTFLVDEEVLDLPVWAAILVSAGSLVAAWLVYDGLCRTKLSANGALFGAVGYALAVAAAWGLGQVFSGRAAYLHLGAMIGTIMAANVLFVIIPGQRQMVEAIRAGRMPDPEPGRRGKQRSVHNNYLTLPVLFLMISNHYPLTYGDRHGWAALAVIVAAGVLVRHFFTLRHKGRLVLWLPAGAAALLVGLAVALRPAAPGLGAGQVAAVEIPFDRVRAILNERCTACHAARPTEQGIAQPPAGVMLETPAQIRRHAARIYDLAVVKQVMPAGNRTDMTLDERAALGAWYAAGAPTN